MEIVLIHQNGLRYMGTLRAREGEWITLSGVSERDAKGKVTTLPIGWHRFHIHAVTEVA